MIRTPIKTGPGGGEADAAPGAISTGEDVAANLGKSAATVDDVVRMLQQLPVLSRPRDFGFQIDSLELVKGAILDGQALINRELLGLPAPVVTAPLIKLPVGRHLH